MRHWFYILLLFALALVTARPLLTAPFFYSDDGLDHLFRLFALDRTIHQGVVYPRWIPDLAFGYGYPIFDFYPPLAAYVAETIHLLGLGFADAIKGTFFISIIVGITGAFAMGSELYAGTVDAKGTGLLTAVTYVFFPYFLIDIYARGALAETLAASILPWLIWSLCRGLRTQAISYVLLIGLISALVLMAHSLTLLIVAPVLLGYVLIELSQLAAASRPGALARLAASGVLGAGLSAVYWLPFAAEIGSTRMGTGIDSIAAVFRDHFLAPSDLIQSSLVYRYGDAPFPLGLAPVLLGFLALAVAIAAGNKLVERRSIFFWSAVSIFAALALMAPMRDVWLALPSSTVVQYPWRVSILVGLGLSITISSLPNAVSKFGWLESRRYSVPSRIPPPSNLLRLAVLGVIGAGVIWAAIGNLDPQELFFPRGEPTTAQLARFEAYTGFIGTTTWGEYLPTAVNAQNLTTLRAAKEPPDSNTVRVQIDDWAGTERRLHVSASQPATITLRSLYSPEWRATLDVAPVNTFANSPAGLLAVQVPAGEHLLSISWYNTLAQQAGTGISVVSTLILAGLTIYAFRLRWKHTFAPAIVLGTALLVFLIPASAAFAAEPAVMQMDRVTISPQLDLVGLSLGGRLQNGVWQVSDSSASLHLDVYWFTKQSTDDKAFSWRLVDSRGSILAQRGQLSRYGTGNAGAWIPYEIVEDQFDFSLPPALPPGRYVIQVAFGGDYVTACSLDLPHGSAPAPLPVPIPYPLNAQVGKQVRLVGYDSPQTSSAGARLPLTLYWKTDGNVGSDYTVFVQLLDVDGNVAARPLHDTIPGGGLSPTFLWSPGELVADRHDFDLPRDLQPGLYRLIAGMYNYPNLSRLTVVTDAGPEPDDVVPLGDIKIPMEASSARPAHPLALSLGPAIRLAGYDMQVQSQAVALKLYWQARAKIGTDYKVFIHIVDRQGQIVAQEDGLPDEGRYPTRIWDAGEQILDPYQISTQALPAGRYHILVGMYAPESGERLLAVDQDGLDLAERQVELATFDVAGR